MKFGSELRNRGDNGPWNPGYTKADVRVGTQLLYLRTTTTTTTSTIMESSSATQITLNVGGVRFMTTTDTLQTLPDTRLGRLATDKSLTSREHAELFFDRNPDLMNSLLDLYRTGELHLPRHLCSQTVERELKFWDVPVELIQECCYKGVENQREDREIIKEIDKFLTHPFDTPEEIEKLSAWNRVWLIMERPGHGLVSKIWGATFITLVFLSVLFYLFQTSMSFRDFQPLSHNLSLPAPRTLEDEYLSSVPKPWLSRAEVAVFVFFLVEFLVRVLTCPMRGYMARQLKTWFDLLMLVHTGVSLSLDPLMEGKESFSAAELDALTFFYSLSVIRVLRIGYLAKHFDSMKILLLSTRASLKVLLLLALCLMSLAAIFGSAVFLAEYISEDYTFPSIPYGLWYAIVTMTTVGYGDVVPVGSVGRLLGVLCALCGVIVMALPVAVVASKFSSYHDNISSRVQMKARFEFLKNHPGFLSPCAAAGESGRESTCRTCGDQPACRSVLGERKGEKGKEEEEKEKKKAKDGPQSASCLCVRVCQQRKRRKSHPVLVVAPE
ncbi:potassium voltage-gated channel protein Shaw-like [Babylonia areolata]|uniref:potassium voltage-gated channel protein Shaw-like n=1 Tax=Babylonia areolata TaxID=304850 RepID=UPI003FCF0D7C